MSKLRMLIPALVVLILGVIVFFLAQQQVLVLVYKLLVFGAAGVASFYLDRFTFPYARPDSYLAEDWRTQTLGFVQGQPNHMIVAGQEWPFMVACLRRTAIMAAAILTVGLAL